MRPLFWIVLCVCIMSCAPARHPIAGFGTNEEIIRASREQVLDLDNIRAVFDSVFASLHDAVTVYPTENYYYFKFFTNSREIWGNLRFDSIDREEGKLSFAYFEVQNLHDYYLEGGKTWHHIYTADEGVVLKKEAPLVYTVSANGRTVTFHLNNLTQEVPAGMTLRPTEEFVSRNCDESGFELVLVFDRQKKGFRYILDESQPLPDLLRAFGKDIWLGARSGFAFYQEPDLGRKMLIAVNSYNVEVNNYFDGPFDQLGDNFIKPEIFEKQLMAAYPFYRGKVRGRGDFVDEKGARISSRILVSPYFAYAHVREIWSRVAQCQKIYKDQASLSDCISKDEKQTAAERRKNSA